MNDGDRPRILIVDDLEINRMILEEIIRDMGCTPVVAESGEQALEKAEESELQLVLSDISMPGMDGYELCRRLKRKKRTRNIPVIFISAFNEPENIVEGLSLGGEDYITKPFIPEVVQARVGVHLSLHRANRELTEMNRRLQTSVNEQVRQLEQEKKNILYALADIAGRNSSHKEEYRKRLSRNCRILAQGMQLSLQFEDRISDIYIDTIELAAPLCDIGNVGVPMDLLARQAVGELLTEEEKGKIRNHTEIGAKFLRELYVGNDYNDFICMAIDIVHYHHEDWDGGGYPNGLRGEEIPLAAQIVAMMQNYCTLTEKEEYDREAALEIMGRKAGVKFNPDIFGICCKISRQLC